jgi:F420-dependent oxidoreductase-like protein
MELGFHIADFTWNHPAAELGPTLGRVAVAAEAAGVGRLTVVDHLWQVAAYGTAEEPMLEAYTTLGYLAAVTQRVRLHALVTSAVYRDPGLLAKMISTLDVLSGGRAGLGIGAAWYEAEAVGLGLLFPPLAERFERLEETLQICRQMWSGTEQPYQGQHYQLGRTLNVPLPLSGPEPFLMVGGSGEQKTLRLVAQYATACNLFFRPDSARRLDVLRSHCDAVGRDYERIEKTTTIALDASSDRSQLLGLLSQARDTGFTTAYLYARNPSPLAVVDLLAEVIPEISRW